MRCPQCPGSPRSHGLGPRTRRFCTLAATLPSPGHGGKAGLTEHRNHAEPRCVGSHRQTRAEHPRKGRGKEAGRKKSACDQEGPCRLHVTNARARVRPRSFSSHWPPCRPLTGRKRLPPRSSAGLPGPWTHAPCCCSEDSSDRTRFRHHRLSPAPRPPRPAQHRRWAVCGQCPTDQAWH